MEPASVVERALAFDGMEGSLCKQEVVAGEAELVVPRQDRSDAIKLAQLVDRASKGNRVCALVGAVERAAVESVAGDEVLAFGLVQSDVAGRVPRRMDD